MDERDEVQIHVHVHVERCLLLSPHIPKRGGDGGCETQKRGEGEAKAKMLLRPEAQARVTLTASWLGVASDSEPNPTHSL
jgi:hypothetical protein